MSRLYAVESLFTLTGANADHRLRVAASLIGQVAATICTLNDLTATITGCRFRQALMPNGFLNARKI